MFFLISFKNEHTFLIIAFEHDGLFSLTENFDCRGKKEENIKVTATIKIMTAYSTFLLFFPFLLMSSFLSFPDFNGELQNTQNFMVKCQHSIPGFKAHLR